MLSDDDGFVVFHYKTITMTTVKTVVVISGKHCNCALGESVPLWLCPDLNEGLLNAKIMETRYSSVVQK